MAVDEIVKQTNTEERKLKRQNNNNKQTKEYFATFQFWDYILRGSSKSVLPNFMWGVYKMPVHYNGKSDVRITARKMATTSPF